MNMLVQFLVPALAVSLTALLALRLGRNAPPTIKLMLASIGISAWFIPWPLLTLTLPSFTAAGVAGWVVDAGIRLTAIEQDVATAVASIAPVGGLSATWALVLFAPGLIWFSVELKNYRQTLDQWRKNSSNGRHLKRFLPESIREHSADIRVVSGSAAAVASGWFKPTVWVGARLVDEAELGVALTHEWTHIRRMDPLWLMVLGLATRLYWFNPFTYALRRHAILAIEARCDEECARLLGRQPYRNTLAHLILENQVRRRFVALMPTLRSSSVDCARLALLTVGPRMDGRVWAGLILFAMGCVGGTAWATLSASEYSVASGSEIAASSRYGYDLPPDWTAN